MATPQEKPEEKRLQCCVKGCSSREENVAETLYVIPPNMNPRGRRWLEIYPHSFEREPNVDNYICVRHFTPECFNKDGGLLHFAIPSVNIDISYAQDILMQTLIMKVVYEWVLRNSFEPYTLDIVWEKVQVAKVLLGMQIYTRKTLWTSRFEKFRIANERYRIRFGSGQKGPKSLLGIIKDIRAKEVPSNFKLPADSIVQFDSEEDSVKVKEDPVKVKEEDNSLSEDEEPADAPIQIKVKEDPVKVKEEDNSLSEDEEPADAPIQINYKDVIPHKTLDTYQEVFDLLKPLKDYITRTGNKNASLRLSEIETVVKQVIQNDSKPRRSSKRRR